MLYTCWFKMLKYFRDIEKMEFEKRKGDISKRAGSAEIRSVVLNEIHLPDLLTRGKLEKSYESVLGDYFLWSVSSEDGSCYEAI